MEWERMGFDLSMLGYCVLAIAFLIAAEAGLVAYVRRAITRWEQEETGGAREHFDSNHTEDTSTDMIPEKYGHHLDRGVEDVVDDVSRRDILLPMVTTTS